MLAYLSGRVLGPVRGVLDRPGPAAAGGAEHRRGGAASSAPTPRDFRLWVCLHEVTHRTQFTAVPWLRAHFLAEVAAFVDAGGAADQMAERVRHAVGGMVDVLRNPESRASVLDLVQTPAQRTVLDRITALMTLLEGHAEFVMDGVGPEVVPIGQRDPGQVQPAPRGRQPGREDDPAAARHRRQDAPVRRGAPVRPRGGVAGRHGRLQPGSASRRSTLPLLAEARRPAGVDRPGAAPAALPAAD